MHCHRPKISLIVFFCFLPLMFGIPSAGGQSEHTVKLIEGAKKEGRLVWYTSMNISDSRLLLEAFEKKYPFIKTDLYRASGERTMNRILTETRAERWEFDLACISAMDALVHNKRISPYISPEAKAYVYPFKDPDHHWTAIYNNYYVIGYNSGLVSDVEAPQRWEDLLDPKWKGKISIDQEEYPWYAALLAAWGKEKTQKYMKSLAKQNIQWRKGHTLIAQLVTAGEFPVAIVYAHRVESMKKKGAPIEWVNTVDPIVVSVFGIGLSAKPNNPNAAKLFVDFVLSKEAQEMIRSFHRIPARSDVEPLSPRMDQKRLKFKVVPADMETRYNDYVQEFRKIFGL